MSSLGIMGQSLRCRVSQSRCLLIGVIWAVSIGAILVLPLTTGEQPLPGRLATRINPNTASVGSLTRLPGVGLTRAKAIVAYRDRIRQETTCSTVFACPGDLEHVDGIGPKTAAGLAGWLQFE